MDRDNAFDELVSAYTAAWAIRVARGDDSLEILRTELDRPVLKDVFGSEGVGRDMLARIWERGVRPEKLKSAVRHEVAGMALHTFKTVGHAYLSIARSLAGGTWVREDLSCLGVPAGHRKLSDDRKAFDLVLRHFHKPVDVIELDVTLDPAAAILAERSRIPSPNRRDAFELPAWLRLGDRSPGATVMVGAYPVGYTDLPATAWQDLTVESAKSVYADGRLFLPMTSDKSATIECVVPRPAS